MTPAGEIIARAIADHGPITVARFMALALTDPEHGYYATRDPLGAAGDFITAPEISQMFGELIGLWAAVVWERMGRPEDFVLAELGPGRGTLMADALRAARTQPGFVEAARLHLVETSPVLRARQGEALAGHDPTWHETVAALPPGPALVIANEFFDALPVHQFVFAGGRWHERLVTRKGDGFAFTTGAAIDAAGPFDLPPAATDGAIVEACPAATDIARALGRRFAREGGAALVVDYGYGAAEASAARPIGDTLQAVRGHERADPLADPGRADITAHVDFTALARAAAEAGAAVYGPLGQGWFLLALGIAERARRLGRDKSEGERRDIDLALRRLIAPSEMGTLFKVLAFGDPRLGALPGFEPAPGEPGGGPA